MKDRYIKILLESMDWSVERFRKPGPDEPMFDFLRSVLADMMVQLPQEAWETDQLIRMVDLFFTFEKVIGLEKVDNDASEEEVAAFELLRNCPWVVSEEQKKFQWLAHIVRNFTLLQSQQFLDMVKARPEYFDDNAIYSVRVH